MKRTIISAAVLTLLAGGVGVATAEPGPNGKNNRGLCTAYFSGSENGREHKRKAGPFAELERQAHEAEKAANGGEDDPNTDTVQEVMNFCNDTAPGFGNNGGGDGDDTGAAGGSGNSNGGGKGRG